MKFLGIQLTSIFEISRNSAYFLKFFGIQPNFDSFWGSTKLPSDLYHVAGEFNTNGRLQNAQHGGENPTILHSIAKRNDSAQNCSRAEEFQPNCLDSKCPDCCGDFLNVDHLYDEALCGTVAHNVIGQIPNDDEVNVTTQLFGQAEFDRVDKTRFNATKGIHITFN